MAPSNLGIDAYASPEFNNADLLENLEGCRVHRFSPGHGEHAGTALMAVELPTNDGLGVQIDMDTDRGVIPTYACTEDDDGWTARSTAEYQTTEELESECPELEILEVVHYNLMDAETARVVAILTADKRTPYGVDIYLDDDGQTEFFEVPV